MTKWLRKSEYEFALNLARKERRRGDVIAADRWLKHADRHLAIADRFRASRDASMLREAELSAARVRESANREELLRVRAQASLQKELWKIEESFRQKSY
jgi:hypothetical protein